MKEHLSVGIKGVCESAQEFVEAWQRTEHGQPVEQPIERFYFEDLATMPKVLTPRQLEALKVVHEMGPVNARALAGKMKREYKKVHHDFQFWSGFVRTNARRSRLVSKNCAFLRLAGCGLNKPPSNGSAGFAAVKASGLAARGGAACSSAVTVWPVAAMVGSTA
jgi:predicted transcriptional regulator